MVIGRCHVVRRNRHGMTSEHAEQVRLFNIAAIWASQGIYPELELLHAVPMGGLRHKGVARKLKAEGAKAGVPDICLPVARDMFHGLYIEMKVGRNKPTEHQQWWINKLREQGYRVEVAYGCQAALDVLVDYLTGGEDE